MVVAKSAIEKAFLQEEKEQNLRIAIPPTTTMGQNKKEAKLGDQLIVLSPPKLAFGYQSQLHTSQDMMVRYGIVLKVSTLLAFDFLEP